MCQHGDVQLVPLPGSINVAGKVEVCVNGVWSNICGRGWSSHDAGVVCRQLGYSSHGMHFCTWHCLSSNIINSLQIITGVSAYSGHSNNRVAWPYTISTVNCNGSEAQILDCVYSTHFAECGHMEAAYVHCQPGR